MQSNFTWITIPVEICQMFAQNVQRFHRAFTPTTPTLNNNKLHTHRIGLEYFCNNNLYFLTTSFLKVSF
jgi:hypothetical protein